MLAKGYANGANVAGSSGWPDEVGTQHFGQTTSGNQPTYRTADAATNSQPSVLFDGVDDRLTNATTGASISHPFSVVAIAQYTSIPSSGYLMDQNAGARIIIGVSTSQWQIFAGTAQKGGTPTTGIHSFVGYFNTTSSTLKVDNSTVASGNTGSNAYTDFTMNPATGAFSGRIAFLGIKAGDVTADAGWNTFKTWASATYGVTF